MKKILDSRFSTTAVSLANAAMAIAKCNHYMVGFDSEATEGVSLDDIRDAKRILVDHELQHGESGRGAATKSTYDIAFSVLATLGFKRYGVYSLD